MVSIYLWHHSKCSCWPAQLHTEFWLNPMHLNFRIVHLKERISKFCIVSRWRQSPAGLALWIYLCFNRIFETLVWCFKLPSANFETKFNSIELILLRYNIYLCKFSLLYLFEFCSTRDFPPLLLLPWMVLKDFDRVFDWRLYSFRTNI